MAGRKTIDDVLVRTIQVLVTAQVPYSDIAVTLNISKATISKYAAMIPEGEIEAARLRRHGSAEAQADALLDGMETMAAAFEAEARAAVLAAGGKRGDATYSQLMTGAGIAVDKMRLLRGESTANENHSVNVAFESALANIYGDDTPEAPTGAAD